MSPCGWYYLMMIGVDAMVATRLLLVLALMAIAIVVALVQSRRAR